MRLHASSFFDRPIVRQTILSICTSMSFFCIGLVRGFSAPAVPSIMENDPELLPTKEIASWASSIPPSGAFVGSLTAGFLLHYLGRKKTILIASPLFTIAWVIISTATNHYYIIAGRFFTGFCVGLCLPSAQVYVSECCDPNIRGILGSLPSIFMSFGILVSYIIGSLVKWNILAWYSCFMSGLLFFLLIFLPESPVWLRGRNRMKEADKSTEWLKLQITTIPVPLEGIKTPVSTIESLKPNNENTPNPHSFKILLSRPILMPLAIGLTLLTIQQVSGIDAIIFFTVEIFKASGSTINEHLATIIVGLVQLLSNIASLFVVDKAGRKPLLLISGIIMCLSTASMGTAFYLNQTGNKNFGYLPLLSLIVFMIGFSFGFGCVPFLLLGEIFPTQQRSILSSIAGSFNLGVMFIVIKTYHYLEKIITTAGTFWMYSIFCACGVIFVIGVVPETKGRDLDSIAKLFVKNREKTTKNASPSLSAKNLEHVNQTNLNNKTNTEPTEVRLKLNDKNEVTKL